MSHKDSLLQLTTQNVNTLSARALDAAKSVELSGERLKEAAVDMTRRSDQASKQTEIMGVAMERQTEVVSEAIEKTAGKSEDVINRMAITAELLSTTSEKVFEDIKQTSATLSQDAEDTISETSLQLSKF